MEYIDIFDENNNPTGEIKEKKQAHKDGDLHRTAHVWIINDKDELLLQKRSASKETHPNYWDISAAGHIRAGETVIQGAIRELKEEIGVVATESEFNYITTIKLPNDTEFGYVYLLQCNKNIDEYIFEDKEVSEVKYIYYKQLEEMVKEKVEGLLLHTVEYKYLFEYIRNVYMKNKTNNTIVEIKFDENEQRSIAYDNDIKIGECDFIVSGNCWNITHTEVNSEYQGQGIARRLVETIIKYAKDNNKSVIADCSYAKRIIEKNQE